MKTPVVFIAAFALTLAPAAAQETPDTDVQEGFDLMEQGARLLMRGLLDEVEPAISDLRESFEQMGPTFTEFAQSVGPALFDLLNQVDDFRNYEAPEFLPNGDIIIRRRPDAPIWRPENGAGEIEL